MKKGPTLSDIAKALNTNVSTVSRALNNHPRISKQMREKVQRLAKEMGYQANAIARQLKRGSSKTIGLIVPRINRSFFANVIHGVESIAKEAGYHVLICQSNDSEEEEYHCLNLLASQNVVGIIMSLASNSTETRYLQELINRGEHIIMFDRVHIDLPFKKVVNANRKSAYLATKHLLEEGYRKIAHFGGPLAINIYRDRFRGYQEALEEYGLALDPGLIFHACLTREEGYQQLQQLRANQTPFDAIFAASDFSALGALCALQDLKIKIPEEVGVFGFANEPFTELIGLSSVEQFSEEMGKAAARLLLSSITEEKVEGQPEDLLPDEVLMPLKLMLRRSSQRKGAD